MDDKVSGLVVELRGFSDVGRDKRVEAKLLDGDTELGKLSFVGLNHVRVSLSDLLQLSLDLPDGLVLELLDLLKRAADHAKCLGVDPGSCQNLIGLGILRLQALLNRLQFLLHDQVTKTSLAVDVVDDGVELVEELLLLVLQVLVLLESHFVLPLNVLVFFLDFDDSALLIGQLLPHLVVLLLFLHQEDDVLLDVLQGLDDHVVSSMLLDLVSVCSGFTASLDLEVGPQGANHVHVESGDVVVVVPDVLVLLLVLSFESVDSAVLLGFNLRNFQLALRFHVFAKTSHLSLVLFLDLAANAFELLPLGSGEGIVVLVEGVDVVGVAYLLLLFLDFEGAQILLQLTLVDAMLVLGILEFDLRLFLDHSLLV